MGCELGCDHPIGLFIKVVTSFWLSASQKLAFSYLNDHEKRCQWDVICNGNPVREVMQLPTGNHSSNVISILKTYTYEDTVIFQETMVSPVGSMLVFAPIDRSNMLKLANGVGIPNIPIFEEDVVSSKDDVSEEEKVDMLSKTNSIVNHIVHVMKTILD